jgi:flagellar motor switch protein FliN/FliY
MTGPAEGIPQSELDRLVREASGAAGRAASVGKSPASSGFASAPIGAADPERAVHEQVDALLAETRQQTQAAASAERVEPRLTARAAQSYQLPELSGATLAGDPAPLDLIGDVELDLRIELGRTSMRLDDVLRLRGGSVVVLDKLAGDPVDIYVNERLVARGEVLVLNDNFCVRVTELLATQP